MSRRFKKRIALDVPVVDIADRGKVIAKDQEGKVYIVNGAVPGDVVDILVTKKRKSYFQGIIQSYKSYAPDRTHPKCEYFGVCGGCKWQHMDYEAQKKYKYLTVLNAMTRIGKLNADVLCPILGADKIYRYRNKLEYSFSNKRWLTTEEIQSEQKIRQSQALGFHAPGSFDKVVDVHQCHLQENLSDEIRNFVREFTTGQDMEYYDARAHTGLMRNMILRNTTRGDWMVIISFAYEDDKIFKLLDAMIARFPQISSLHYVINQKHNDTILDQDIIRYHGMDFIVEQIGDIKYKIGPKSFFQTNTRQAKILFDTIVKWANFEGHENVYDLYTGLGSIALYISDKVGHVTGIEEVEAAIEDAKENALYNGIKNTTFYAGDVKDILSREFEKKHGSADIVITDPPRVGMHKDVILTLLRLEAPKIIYVSCNPATQARDMELLSRKYDVKAVQPVDMFPHTHHIESVALLVKKSDGQK